MKKINCSFCFKNFMQVQNRSNCPYCGKESTNEEFVKCKQIDVVDFDTIKDLKENYIDDEINEEINDIDMDIEDNTDDDIQVKEIDDETENEHNEDTEITD